MIIWSGRGILVPLITLLLIVISTIVSASFNSTQLAIYMLPIAFLLAGWANWHLGKKWNDRPGRIVVDEATGERIELKARHTFFWIKMQHWGTFLLAIGALNLLVSLLALIF
ncbi:hypothetical protein N7E81_07460 [Reichenbachiella carrageenanivorans]|uniref:DUF3899 domain-containing protein n=1 Tax=Reichenbachiella carrageenanivorans TaxID=2979869 RepID=A0ABY6D472_9BACT|nr:hypothetical protein [Reichenbachiella carrageenanivorans]UXX80935.1 hypothetical protein N7E81_07460 [Reichenbachiella carrageenanivorans]